MTGGANRRTSAQGVPSKPSQAPVQPRARCARRPPLPAVAAPRSWPHAPRWSTRQRASTSGLSLWRPWRRDGRRPPHTVQQRAKRADAKRARAVWSEAVVAGEAGRRKPCPGAKRAKTRGCGQCSRSAPSTRGDQLTARRSPSGRADNDPARNLTPLTPLITRSPHSLSSPLTPPTHSSHSSHSPSLSSRHTPQVIAVRSGGPCETVLDGVTGWLCESTPVAFGTAFAHAVRLATSSCGGGGVGGGGGGGGLAAIGLAARAHVEALFILLLLDLSPYVYTPLSIGTPLVMALARVASLHARHPHPDATRSALRSLCQAHFSRRLFGQRLEEHLYAAAGFRKPRAE